MFMKKISGRRKHKIPYIAHPDSNQLPAMIPRSYVEASKFTQVIAYADLKGMWKTVKRLSCTISKSSPDLIFFFATGGIPYMLPSLQRFSVKNIFYKAHLFPGLAWCGDQSKQYFTSEAESLIRNACLTKSKSDVLFVDTTNVGNAVNNILQSIESLYEINGIPNFNARVIGIVSAKGNRESGRTDGIEIKRCGKPSAWIVPPSGWQYSHSAVWNNQSICFRKQSFSVSVCYWVVDNIPTEDEAGLLGAKGIHHSMRVRPGKNAGRIRVEYPGKGTTDIAGGNVPGSTLMNLLASESKSAPWKALKTASFSTDIGFDSMKLFELLLSEQKASSSVIINQVMKNKNLLSPEEIYFIISRDKSLRNHEKILASLNNPPNKETMQEAYESALTEPTDNGQAADA